MPAHSHGHGYLARITSFFRTSELYNKLLCFSPSGKELYLMRAGPRIVSYHIVQDYIINMRMYAANAIRLFARYEDLLAVSRSDSVGSE